MISPIKMQDSAPTPDKAGSDRKSKMMLAPSNAWRLLCRSTGGDISRATFYRWLGNGKIYSIRLGFRIFIPWPALEEVIKACLAGERF